MIDPKKILSKVQNEYGSNLNFDKTDVKELLKIAVKMNKQLAISRVVVPKGTLPHKYCPQCGEPIGKSHKFWCEVRD